MGGFIIGVGLAALIVIIIYIGKQFAKKRNNKNSDAVELTLDKKENSKEKE